MRMGRKRKYNPGDVFTLDKEKGIRYILLGRVHYGANKNGGSYAFMCANCGRITVNGGPSKFLKTQKNKINMAKDKDEYCKFHNVAGAVIRDYLHNM